MDFQMKTATFKPRDPTLLLLILDNFKAACHSNIILKTVAMWLFPHVIREPAKVALSYRGRAANNKYHNHDSKLATYPQGASYFLDTCATDYVITEAEAR